jgi:hypothetical protein
MCDFFIPRPNARKDDVCAAHFLGAQITFDLSNWAGWRDAMDKQLLHITFTRVTKPKEWKGHVQNKLFLDEFKRAWKLFLRNCPSLTNRSSRAKSPKS